MEPQFPPEVFEASPSYQARADELSDAKANVLKSFAAFMAQAGDDLRKLVDAENGASVHNKFRDHVLSDMMYEHRLWSPVNDWSDLVDIESAEDYVAFAPAPIALAAE